MSKEINLLLWKLSVTRRTTIVDRYIFNIKSFSKWLYKRLKPKRKIYAKGSVFYFTYGEPALRDKIEKFLCDKFFDVPVKYKKSKMSTSQLLRVHATQEFFDYSTGTYQDRKSKKYLDSLAARGKMLISDEEAEHEASKNKRRNIEAMTNQENEEYMSELEKYFVAKNIKPSDLVKSVERMGGNYNV